MSLELQNKYKAVRGWAEILYRRQSVRLRSKNTILLPEQFQQQDYEVVGSWLPLQEYVFTIELIKDLMQPSATEILGIPRPLQFYDAITLCTLTPPSIGTLFVLPAANAAYYERHNAQLHPDYGVILAYRPEPFKSFRHEAWPRHLGAADEWHP